MKKVSFACFVFTAFGAVCLSSLHAQTESVAKTTIAFKSEESVDQTDSHFESPPEPEYATEELAEEKPAIGGDHPVAIVLEPTPDEPAARVSMRRNTVEAKPLPTETTPEIVDETPKVIELSATDKKRRDSIRTVLGYYYQRPENASLRSPWGIMHGMIAYGVDAQVHAQGRKVNSVGYLCYNGPGRGMRLFTTKNGEIAPKVGPGYQGHEGQFLAMMAQSQVPRNYPMNVNGKKMTLENLIKYEQDTCRPNTELTFKLIALAHYLPSDATWKSNDGQTWSIQRLIQEDIKQPVIGAACGGTHRMMGFGFCVKRRVDRGEEILGQWQRAEKYTDDFHNYAINLQNRDGSFSTKWFEGRGFERDVDRRMQTSGHILEWLVYTLPESQLRDARMVKAVDYLTNLMWTHRNNRWEVGPKGHAIRALSLYDQRVYGGKLGLGVGERIADYGMPTLR